QAVLPVVPRQQEDQGRHEVQVQGHEGRPRQEAARQGHRQALRRPQDLGLDGKDQEGPIAPALGGPGHPGPPAASLGAMPRLDRATWPVAAACAAWAAVFAWDEPRGSLAAVPLVFAGVWLLPRRTKTG